MVGSIIRLQFDGLLIGCQTFIDEGLLIGSGLGFRGTDVGVG